jgi:FtsZ-interacting cell division protein ZipA
LGFQASKKRSNSILEKKWPRNNTNVKDDPYETLALAYNREMDQLMVAKAINNKVEEENLIGPEDKEESEGPKTTHPINTTIDSNNEKEEPTTPRSIMDKEVEELVTPRLVMDKEVEKPTTPR